MSEEDEWTTDMTFPVGNGYSMVDVSKYIKEHFESSNDFEELYKQLCAKFSLLESDAELAIERAVGGIVRGLTTNIENEPDPKEDPIANFMFHEVWSTLPIKDDSNGERIIGGKWHKWDEKRKNQNA